MNDSTLPGFEPDGVDIRRVRVTPEMAAAWLTRNIANRTISADTVDRYASDMTAGKWTFTGQPIVFDDAGNLSDGQHRLTAQIKAEQVIEWLVIRGVPSEVQDFIDIGRPRTVANQLQIKGLSDANMVAAIARMALIYEGDRNPSKPTVRERAEKDCQIFAKSGHYGRSIAQVIGGSAAAYGYAHYRTSLLDAEAADTFFESLASGADLPATNPILIVRQFVLREYKGTSKSWNDPQRVGFVDHLFKAWNLWRDGKRLKSFSRPSGHVEPK